MTEQMNTDEWLDANHRLLQVWTERTQRWMEGMLSGNPAALDHPPVFEDLLGMNRKLLSLGTALTELMKEFVQYQAYIGPAFYDIWQRYLVESNGDALKAGSFEEAWDKWFAYANDEMVELQHSEAYLDANQRLGRALTQFKTTQRKITDYLLTRMDMPTQQEVDNIGRSLFELKREVRKLKEQIRALNAEQQAAQSTPEEQEKLAS